MKYSILIIKGITRYWIAREKYVKGGNAAYYITLDQSQAHTMNSMRAAQGAFKIAAELCPEAEFIHVVVS